MSRQNKVNPDHYTLAGRLSPDDLARERRKQSEPNLGPGRRRARKALPPWMAEEQRDGGQSGEVPEQQPQAKPQLADVSDQPGGLNREPEGKARAIKKRERRATETGKQSPSRRASTDRRRAKPRGRLKASGAAGTAKTRKAPRARASAAREASPQRRGRPGAHKTASRGRKKATSKKR